MAFTEREKNRVRKSARNIFTSAFFQTVLGIIAFVERTVFLKYLDVDYLGLNSLFSNVLYVLSIAELGLGSAIAFMLYKPLAEDNHNKISVYMHFFKKAYTVIGSIIIIVGLCLSPFIRIFATSSDSIGHIGYYFIIYLLAIGCTYFFSYKQILIEADQKKYINQTIICLGSIIQSLLQMFVLYKTSNYALYLAVFFICNIGKNLIISVYADRLYPFLKKHKSRKSDLTASDRKSITRNIKAMCFHKLGGIAIGSSDSILISYLIDIRSLGLYANYLIIIDAVKNGMRVFYSSVLASIGNMCATEDDENIYYAFKTLNFTNYILFSYVTVLLFNLIQTAITLWLGKDLLLPISTVALVCVVLFLNGTRSMILNFHDAYGLFWADKYKRVLEAVVNIIVSFVFGKLYGLNGIFIGTIASNLVGFWIDGWAVYRYAFHRNVSEYIFMYIRQFLVTVVVLSITFGVNMLVRGSGLISVLIRIVISMLIPIGCYYLIYHNNSDFIALKNNVADMLHMVKRK